MKKTLLLLVALITATIAFAQTEFDGIYYKLNDETKTAQVTYQYYWDENNYSGVTTTTIPEKVTYNATEYSVTSIGDYAFWNCESLTSITIPNSVTYIGGSAFSFCSSLTSITIPNSVISIGYEAFSVCSSLTSIEVDANNPNYASIDGVLYNKDVTTLICCPGGKTSITIGNSVTSIEDGAFDGCSSLTSITIPNSVTSIGDYAFHYCSSLTSIEVDANNPNYASIEGVLYNKDVTTLICCPGGKTSITIPNSVTSIGEHAFYNCTSLTSITIPNSITSIGDDAFYNCDSLKSITIPNSVTSIGDYAFSSCSSLTSITIPNSVTSIGNSAFYNCSFLTSITIEATTPPTLGTSVFKYTKLAAIYIPDNTLSAYKEAWGTDYNFANNENTLTIHVETPGTLADKIFDAGQLPAFVTKLTVTGTLNDDDFTCMRETMTSLVDIDLSGITNASGVYFIDKGNLLKILLPENLTSIGDYAFCFCSSLTSITIPNSVTSIGEWAFFSCSSLTSITIPNSVTSIGNEAFGGISGSHLTSITCLGSTPPKASVLGADTENCTLKVPNEAYNDYLQHAYWGQFSNIETLDTNLYKKLEILVNDTLFGYVNVSNGYYCVNDSITIHAIPNEGYEFTQWSDGNTENPRTICITSDTTITAEFRVATTPTTVENTLDNQIKIYTTNGTLHIEGATDDYHILDAAGRLIYSGNATTLQLPRGIYLITMGGEVEKIVL